MTNGTHRVGEPIMLNWREIERRIAKIEQQYGSFECLKAKSLQGFISVEERRALLDLGNYRFLLGG